MADVITGNGKKLVGTSVRRKEDPDVLLGRETYTADLKLPGMVYAAIFRSPYAHALLKRVDLRRALALPGVIFGITGDSLPDFLKPMSLSPYRNVEWAELKVKNPQMNYFPHVCLARERVRFVGEPVAAVVATDPYVAEDALELIEAEFDPLPVVTSVEQALQPDAPLLYEEWGDNVQLRFKVSGGDVERAFREADLVVKETVISSRYTGTPMEPRVVIGRYSAEENYLEVWDTTQRTHSVSMFVRNSIDLPDLQVRVITLRVGGGFGQKRGFYSEEVLIPLLSILTHRPVKWVETRSEHMVGTSHGRQQVHQMEAAVKRDGTVLALRDRILADLGVAYPTSGTISVMTTLMFIPGAYRIQNYEGELLGVNTNKTVYGSHRAFGKADAAYAIERFMDVIAQELGMDPAELRLKNFIQPHEFPYLCVTGSRYDSGNYPQAFQDALKRAGNEKWREEQKRGWQQGRYLGIGVSLVIEPNSASKVATYNAGHYGVRMQMDPTGGVTVFCAGNDEGQGHGTAIGQLVADELGVEFDRVHTVEGDSLLCPFGSGSYSARFAVVGTSAVIMASRRLKEKLVRIAAQVLGVGVEEVRAEGGAVEVLKDPSRRLSYQQIAQVAYFEVLRLPAGVEPGLEVLYYYIDSNLQAADLRKVPDERGRYAVYSTFPYAANVAVVEVDVETGRVRLLEYVSTDDCGRMINPAEVVSQYMGAFAHGLGGAFYEELVYDEGGQPLAQNFKDYLVPTALEVPRVKLAHMETPNPFTPGGFKGASETGAVGPTPTIANAVEDALRPLGVKLRRIPITPAIVWEAIQKAKGLK
ncbi:MAG: xanthine dehydrogenase family protein molybdopterin-binding subunit [Candidatus Tectomicrobia bacterium]|uniref:Xanthine dehydrogenase family protein molybdopterin-binding subunit n=1 Tax=Tectimicrobiota bacterium TaxID=2528274 RepID=A0A932GMX5_UNCTE|nr:xanthine dehydrogenase family protein molybdopterin-binding subunit [Candidatus Tectomicrobia bacterium]